MYELTLNLKILDLLIYKHLGTQWNLSLERLRQQTPSKVKALNNLQKCNVLKALKTVGFQLKRIYLSGSHLNMGPS